MAISQWIGLSLGVLLFVVFISTEIDDDYPLANDMLACTGLVVCFWAFEVLPLPVTSLLPLVLVPLCEIAPSSTVAASYWNWVQMLFLGSFIVDIGIEHVLLHQRFALNVLIRVGVGRPWAVVLAFAFISFVISMWCSNTATTIMLTPFALSLIDTAAEKDVSGASAAVKERFSNGVLLAICYTSTCGGISTSIGTVPNGVFLGQPILDNSIGAARWFYCAFPVSLLLAILVNLVLFFVYIRGVTLLLDPENLKSDLAKLGKLNRDEKVIIVTLVLQVAGWLLRREFINNEEYANLPGINDATIACGAAVIPFLVPSEVRRGETVLTWRVAEKNLPWGVLLLMGGGFAIAKGFENSQLSDFIGQKLAGLADLGGLGIAYCIVACICFMTEVTSNTATANIILPILAGVSAQTLTNPLAMMVPATIACSMAFMLPAATPPNAVVFATGRVRISHFILPGFIINTLAIVFASLLIWVMNGAVFQSWAPFPQWACDSRDDCAWIAYPGLVDGRQVSSQACLVIGQDLCSLRDGSVLNRTTLLPS